MGEFVALIDVIPEDVDVNFEELVSKLRSVLTDNAVIESYDIKPVAFGLKKARVRVRYPEEWGAQIKSKNYLDRLRESKVLRESRFQKLSFLGHFVAQS